MKNKTKIGEKLCFKKGMKKKNKKTNRK